MLLCAALKSSDNATHRPNASSLLKVRCTSKLEGKLTFSGTLHAMLALHTVLSRTRRGSFPSAVTMLSLPIAEPAGQCCATALRPAGKGFTQPLATSCSTNCWRRTGLRSACVQLPWQRSKLGHHHQGRAGAVSIACWTGCRQGCLLERHASAGP